MTLDSLPGLYLHIPFCSAVCPYCDFAVRRAGVSERKRFVQHLVAEVALAAFEWRDPRPFDTVYFGGGTPSLLPSEDLARVLDACRTHLNLAEPWVFLEANPEDVTPDACARWRGLGVRTLSLGVQSFSDEALRFLGRRHSADEARAAVETALAAGFDTVSVDLIYGLPAQTEEVWRRDLATAVALGPGHLSCYQLTIHPRTRFGLSAARGQLSELPEGRQAALFDLTHRFLADAGWPAYEVSNFARSGEHQSRHNRKYWDHTPYLGLGPSAHSLSFADEATAPDASTASDATSTADAPNTDVSTTSGVPTTSGGGKAPADAGAGLDRKAPVRAPRASRRWWNERSVPRWESRVEAGERPVEGEESLGVRALATETLMLGLRTTAGIDLDRFTVRHGFDLLALNSSLVESLVNEGHLVVRAGPDGGRWLVPTLSGLAVADGLAAAFDIPHPT